MTETQCNTPFSVLPECKSTPSASSRLVYERAFWHEHPQSKLAGIDEAGRGCLAGPVIAGAVQINPSIIDQLAKNVLSSVNDSKQLSPSKRETLFQIITTHPNIRWAFGQASVEEIDQLNILHATHLAMRRALEALPVLPEHVFVDGLPVKGLPIPHTAIVKGDAKSLLIACASIIAKVTRDHLCLQLDKRYPNYGFAQHKGYGTPAHLKALRAFGPCSEHRHSFAPVAFIQEELSFPSS